MPQPQTILFAGGGTGGHIYPNVAVLQRIEAGDLDRRSWEPEFIVSSRPLDAEILARAGVPGTTLSVQPLTWRPWRWPAWVRAWSASTATVRRLLQRRDVAAVVATGGFVSGPVVVAAASAGIPVALVNLDAVPGKANRALARRCDAVFTVYDVKSWPSATRIGLPLRESAIGPQDTPSARRQLGLEADRETLLILGGSQGARSLNRMMPVLLRDAPELRGRMAQWQLFHVAGAEDQAETLRREYERAGVVARVVPFCDHMGTVWAASTVAISRAGAGSVAEAWANAVPSIFMPYPHHRDQHQKHNAEPLSRLGAAVLLEDRIDPELNASAVSAPLSTLLSDGPRRRSMSRAMRDHSPSDGAAQVAAWLVDSLKRHGEHP